MSSSRLCLKSRLLIAVMTSLSNCYHRAGQGAEAGFRLEGAPMK